MPKELRASAIVAIVQNATTKLGKTQVQKLIYFAQDCGVPLNYRYEIYHYGPYSFELSNDLGSLDSLGVLNIQSDPAGFGFDISVGKFADKFELAPKYSKKIDKVLAEFGSDTPGQLEVKATIHFVHSVVSKKYPATSKRSEILQKVHALKPRYTAEFIRSCYANLERAHWI